MTNIAWRFRALGHIFAVDDAGEPTGPSKCGKRTEPRPNQGSARTRGCCMDCVGAVLADRQDHRDQADEMAERLDAIRALTDPNAKVAVSIKTGDTVTEFCEDEEHEHDRGWAVALYRDLHGTALCAFHMLRSPLPTHRIGAQA